MKLRSRKVETPGHRRTMRMFVLCLAGVSAYNWWLWQRDRVLADRLREASLSPSRLSRTASVSILVAAWNEERHVDAHIKSFLTLGYPDVELILCAGGSDTTFERASRYVSDRVTVLRQLPGEGKQKSLAKCYERARGEIVYLTDADCILRDDILNHILAPIVMEGEDAATGDVCPLDGQKSKVLPRYLWASDAYSSAHSPLHIHGVHGANAAVTRRAIERIGGLDFVARTGTDYHLAQRLIQAGLSIRHVPESLIPTDYPESLQVYRRRRSRWLLNLIRHGPSYSARDDIKTTWRTMLTGAFMLLSGPLALIIGHLALLLWSLVLGHAIGSKVRYQLFAARLSGWPVPTKLLLWLVPVTIADFAVCALPIIDLINPGKREQW